MIKTPLLARTKVFEDMKAGDTSPNFPQSRHSSEKLNSAFSLHDDHVKKGVSVHPSKLRASQKWLYLDSLDAMKHGPTRERADREDPPQGIRTPNGHVHLIDGHHRAYHAVAAGKHLNVDVVDAEP